MFSSSHVGWLKQSDGQLCSSDGKAITVFEFCPNQDDKVLSAWAMHFRNHYCLDGEIDSLRSGTTYSRSDYLTNVKFPDKTQRPGPAIRAGDFGEILVADFLQYIMNFWVPRNRFSDKTVRNESKKGCDIIGFQFTEGNESAEDILAIFESKTQFSGNIPKPRLRDAVKDSGKDYDPHYAAEQSKMRPKSS